MRTEIVHHHHISRGQGRTEEMVQVGKENVSIGGRGDGHRSDHAVEAHRAQDSDDLPVSLRRCFMNARSAEAARKAPRHRGRDTALIEEDESFRVDREDALVELGATDAVGFGVSFDGVERLFFSRRPSLVTHRCTSPQLIETPLSERIRSRSSARVRSGCDLTRSSMCVLTSSVTLLWIPYRDCATRAFCPVAACCRRSLRTYSQLTPKRLASTRQLPSPRSS